MLWVLIINASSRHFHDYPQHTFLWRNKKNCSRIIIKYSSLTSTVSLLCSPKNFGGAYSRRFVRASVRPCVRASVRPSRSCPRKFSETACRISVKLHGNIKYQRWMRISPACSGSMIFPRVIALWWVLHEYIGYCSCPREFSETTSRISLKLHGNIKYGRWMCISPACSGSMIFPRVIALWWVLHEYIGYCSCPREFSETTSRISLKLHGNIKYGRWMCISPACSGSMIFPRVIALWWVLHEYIGYCSCPRKFLANTGRNSTKF